MVRQEFVPGDEYVPPEQEYTPPVQDPGGVYPGDPLPDPEIRPIEEEGQPHIVGRLDLSILERQTDNYRIPHWQYNKVRKILQKIYMSEGYPIRFNHYIGYYSGMGFWLPTFHVVDVTTTNMDWKRFGVDTMMLGIEKGYKPNYPIIPTNELALPWRSIRIKPIPNEAMDMLLTLIPLGIDDAILQLIGVASGHVIPIFDNLGFYNTINNKLIDYNWDIILRVLNSHGY